MKTKRILTLFMLSLFSTNNHCMNKFVLKKSTAILATGLTAGTLCSCLAYADKDMLKILKDNKFNDYQIREHLKTHFKKDLLPLATLAIAIPGALFFSRTHKAFLLRAIRKINKRDMELLKKIKNKTPDELRKNMKDHYIQSGLPAVAAFNDLNKLLKISNKIVELLNIAKTSDDPVIIIKANKFLKELNDEINTIKNAMLLIKSKSVFTQQYAAFQLQNAAEANRINAAANIVNAAVNTIKAIKP